MQLVRVVLGLGDLRGRGNGHVVTEEHPREPSATLLALVARRRNTVLVGRSGRLDDRVVDLGEDLGLLRVGDRRVHLDVLAMGETQDLTALATVEHQLAITALQTEAEPPSGEERQGRQDKDGDAGEPRDPVERQVERLGHDVVGAVEDQRAVERDGHDAKARTSRVVARSVEQVVLAGVTGDPALDEGVAQQQREQDPGDDQSGNEDVPAPGVTKPVGLQTRGHGTQESVEEADVPVRL